MDAGLASANLSVPVGLLTPLPAAPVAVKPAAAPLTSTQLATAHARIDKSAHDFESSFLSIMLGQMFDGVKATTFGGGEGEDAFKSFLTDAMAKAMTKHGGVGISKMMTTEMLKMQGLS